MSPKTGSKTDEHKSVFGNRHKNSDGNGRKSDWGSVDSELLFRCIDAVTSRGGAVRFGYTRDGGAYAVGFYYGNETSTEYCRPSEDINAFLTDWIEFYLNLPSSGGVSPDKG